MQVQDLILGLVEVRFPWAHFSSLSSSLWIVSCPSGMSLKDTAQLGVLCKPAGGAFCPTVQATDEDIKQYWSLRAATHH